MGQRMWASHSAAKAASAAHQGIFLVFLGGNWKVPGRLGLSRFRVRLLSEWRCLRHSGYHGLHLHQQDGALPEVTALPEEPALCPQGCTCCGGSAAAPWPAARCLLGPALVFGSLSALQGCFPWNSHQDTRRRGVLCGLVASRCFSLMFLSVHCARQTTPGTHWEVYSAMGTLFCVFLLTSTVSFYFLLNLSFTTRPHEVLFSLVAAKDKGLCRDAEVLQWGALAGHRPQLLPLGSLLGFLLCAPHTQTLGCFPFSSLASLGIELALLGSSYPI